MQQPSEDNKNKSNDHQKAKQNSDSVDVDDKKQEKVKEPIIKKSPVTMCDFSKIRTNNPANENGKAVTSKLSSLTYLNGNPPTLLPNTYNPLYAQEERKITLSLPRKIKS